MDNLTELIKDIPELRIRSFAGTYFLDAKIDDNWHTVRQSIKYSEFVIMVKRYLRLYYPINWVDNPVLNGFGG